MNRRLCYLLLAAGLATRLAAQLPEPARLVRDSVVVEFVDADLRNVVQALGRYLTKPLLLAGVPSVRVSLQSPGPVARGDILALLQGLLASQNLELVEEPAFMRIHERQGVVPAVVAPAPDATQARTQSAIGLHVIRLLHSRANEVAATVNQLFGGSGQFAGSAGLSSGTLSDELRRLNVPSGPQAAATAAAASSGVSLAGPVTIVPDDITNALLIRATQEDFELIRQAVNELDIRPLQVLIEVLIIEARRDHSFSLGADLFMPEQSLGGDVRGSAQTTGGGLGDLVIKVLNLGEQNISATIRAAESRGNVSILSRPVLLASNNTEARLLVGSQRPFVQVSRSLPTDSPSRDQVVQYRDVGTRLTVKPTINHDGYVTLQIQQEVSAATTETQFDAPIISTRETSTRVLLRTGQTVVIGGLRDLQDDRSRSGVPFLSSLPLVGPLFGGVRRSENATEFYLFLTPRILTTDADADSVTAPRLPATERP